MIVNEEQERLWFISKEGLHTNLFAWSNPYLSNDSDQSPNYSLSANTPDFFRFGASLEELQPILKKQASFIDVDEYDGGEVQLLLPVFDDRSSEKVIGPVVHFL